MSNNFDQRQSGIQELNITKLNFMPSFKINVKLDLFGTFMIKYSHVFEDLKLRSGETVKKIKLEQLSKYMNFYLIIHNKTKGQEDKFIKAKFQFCTIKQFEDKGLKVMDDH